jgi:TldD protein
LRAEVPFVSILRQIDPSSLRRLAASLPDRPSEYADLFLERSFQVSVMREQGEEGPVVQGAAEGAAARVIAPDQVRHASIGRLDPEAVTDLAGRVGAAAGMPSPAAAADEGQGVEAAAGLGRYLGEIESAVLGAAGDLARGTAFKARAELQRRTVAIATSEGEVTEDRRDWIAFSARLWESARDATVIEVSEGGGARDLPRLRALHPPGLVAGMLLRSLREGRDAAPAPSGEMTVVLAPGPGGILFHEACGHALEGDRALKGRSALTDLLGEEVGPADLTLVDDPTLAGLPGSMRVDDEGWPAARNVLIESGRVVGLLLDRATALLAGTSPTGSARRESYRDLPLPRMSNTFVLEGTRAPEEILASVARGVYVAELGAGEVDTVSGDFSFNVRKGYLIAGGRMIAPIAPAIVIGNGLRALRGIEMIGVDLKFDPGAGECGKEGQRARAAVGQPTIRVTGLAVRPAAGAR